MLLCKWHLILSLAPCFWYYFEMMKSKYSLYPLAAGIVIIVFGLSSCVSPLSWSSYSENLSSLGAAAWKSDLSTLESELLGHPKLKSDTALQAQLSTAVSQAMSDIDGAPDSESRRDAAIAGISKACAIVGDGHTRINASPAARYPVALRFFPVSQSMASAEYELRVFAASDENASLLGGKIARIGSKTVEEVLDILAPALSIESALGKPGLEELKNAAIRAESLNAFMNPILMRGLGLADKQGLHLSFDTEASPTGCPAVYTVLESSDAFTWNYAIDPKAPTALSRQKPSENIWYTIPEAHPETLYLSFQSCESDASPIFDEVIQLLKSSPAPNRLIIDMRTNSGGNSMPGTRFAQQLADTEVAKRKGGVVILVGPYTFSSALMNAADILKACGARGDPGSGNAVLAGEPLIEPMDHYGEVVRFSLPNSGLVIGRSSRLWEYSKTSGITPDNGFLSPTPDNLRAPTFEEYRRGQDPVLEMVL